MKRVLVVDDSETVRRELREILESAGYGHSEACDGQEALDLLEKDKDFKLIILDVNMPVLDGLGFLKIYAADPELKKIPIIMVTTETGLDLVVKGKMLGVKAWVIKPFTPELLLKLFKKLIA